MKFLILHRHSNRYFFITFISTSSFSFSTTINFRNQSSLSLTSICKSFSSSISICKNFSSLTIKSFLSHVLNWYFIKINRKKFSLWYQSISCRRHIFKIDIYFRKLFKISFFVFDNKFFVAINTASRCFFVMNITKFFAIFVFFWTTIDWIIKLIIKTHEYKWLKNTYNKWYKFKNDIENNKMLCYAY